MAEANQEIKNRHGKTAKDLARDDETRTVFTVFSILARDPQVEALAGSSKEGGSRETQKVESGEEKKCRVCRKKLGLTGTPCRCGPLFCAAHIHDHGCTYDYKAEAVAELRRNNPVISPPKVTKF